ncbi:MAG: hypothetical protein HOC23_17610, partial [Halieaceae bacterium]|nr:hypothetical protein [Halieaceae bacterium]
MTKLTAVADKAANKNSRDDASTLLSLQTPPPIRKKRLSRPALEERHSGLQDYSFSLLVAPQGYGKTDILSCWHAALADSGANLIWITLDNSCNDPAKLTRTLLNAFAPHLPSDKADTVNESEEPAEQRIQNLCNLLHLEKSDWLLMIDQYENLGESAARELFTDFLFHLPTSTHKVLASRSTPHWMTPRLQIEEDVQVLDREALAFSTPEMEAFLYLEGHKSVSEEEILSLTDVTEGWPAALKLVSLAFKKAKTPRERTNIVHGEFPLLFEYLDRNIISELTPTLQSFVYQTAHLKRLRVDLCNHVCQSNDANSCVQALLEQGLLAGNTYADNWFSYPPILYNFLIRQLQKEGRDKLIERHCRASDWYLEFGLPDASLYHALQAQDHERAIAIYSGNARDLVVTGGASLIEQFIKSLPPKKMEEHPYILWPYVWMLVISQHFKEAEKHLPELKRKLESGVEDNSAIPLTPTPEDLDVIEYRVKQALDSEWAEPAVWLELKRKRGNQEDFLQEQIELSLGSAYFRRSKFSDAYVAFNEAKRLAELNHTPITSVSATTRMAEIRYMQGQLSEAMYLCNEAIDLASLVTGQFSPLSGIPRLLSSRILFDQNRLTESEHSFYEARDMFRLYRATHYLVDSAMHRARLANDSAGWQSALHILEEAMGSLPENIL